MKKVIVLGSTGSIGTNTLDIIRRHPDKFKVLGLSAFSNAELLSEQIKEFKPRYISIFDKNRYKKIKARGASKIFAGQEGLLKLASNKCDILVMGISGFGALRPLVAALGKAKRLLLANKEAIISAGSILAKKMRSSSTRIFPVDSEAWAVSNLLEGTSLNHINSIYITASGGPFFRKSRNQMRKAGIKQVLKHPVWKMGKRISVDSATLMNKGFEVIEIHRLFEIPVEKIKVLVHPQSVIHAFLEKNNGSLLSSLFSADMKIPIGASLGSPTNHLYVRNLDLSKLKGLDFFKPDYKKFPLLKLAYFVAKSGRSFPAVLVASDEEAVSLFLEGKISFLEISKIIEKVIASHRAKDLNGLEDVFLWQAWAKDKVRQIALKKG
ncbi:MAG: 1-deoxy-D-xylulose-5-phosphate reductoisomerase [Candidatus Omnitrophica bacterium]|nr:1-deoxy-D-xylulose-5-phosphate reductoisomerase [Candidatus Omnitrophota bacterium]